MIAAVTIKVPHQTPEGTMIVEHFLVALAAKPKKIGVTIEVLTACGWHGPIKASEFHLHYYFAKEGKPSLPVVNCGACYSAVLDGTINLPAQTEPEDPSSLR
jgi:hypothetical protein